MARVIYTTPCGCVKVRMDELVLIDGDKLPKDFIQIGWIQLGTTKYQVNRLFLTPDSFLSFLNSIFVSEKNLFGKFVIGLYGLYYTNPEQFTIGEIMISYGLNPLVFKIGNPPELVNSESGYDAIFSNGNSFSSPLLQGYKEVQVFVNNIASEPIDVQGHKYQSTDPLLSTNGVITFPYNIEDANLYIILTQKPA